LTTYRDEAVVLRKLDYGEADRIYTLLTRDHGKLGAIARGVRKGTSRLAAPLELFARIDVLLAQGRNLDVISQVQRLPGPRVEADPEQTAHAGLIVELAERVTEDRHPLEGVYELTSRALSDLATEPDPRRATAWFLMAALDLLGFSPQLHTCASCDRELPAQPAAFSAAAGGLLCDQCADPGWRRLALAAIKVLRVMQARDGALYGRLKLEGELVAQVEETLESHLEHHLERRLNSLRFLRQMRAVD
jgi:DNA repair protein RecO (recombination protein O)